MDHSLQLKYQRNYSIIINDCDVSLFYYFPICKNKLNSISVITEKQYYEKVSQYSHSHIYLFSGGINSKFFSINVDTRMVPPFK